MATIHVEGASDAVFNIMPIVEKTKSSKKRSVGSSNYDSQLNSHAIERRTLKGLRFDDDVKFDLKTKAKSRLDYLILI